MSTKLWYFKGWVWIDSRTISICHLTSRNYNIELRANPDLFVKTVMGITFGLDYLIYTYNVTYDAEYTDSIPCKQGINVNHSTSLLMSLVSIPNILTGWRLGIDTKPPMKTRSKFYPSYILIKVIWSPYPLYWQIWNKEYSSTFSTFLFRFYGTSKLNI